ncbi:flagellar assembly protein A [Massilia sp. TS11]|uniref:flagellar assembly protein A n=1 Tax=Massilia sp. TS11 TaxID=2908003 RepID=UPI001EDC70CA|nr:flagellar assembly protein A [Massilia sp. TS11]MCG2583285.1 FapA family protein [Massilia sp. TS11]
MAINTEVGQAPAADVGRPAPGGAGHGIVKRRDGVFVDPALLGADFQAAVNDIFFSNRYFAGLNYTVFIKVLYDCGPDLPRSRTGDALIRFAADIMDFLPERQALYHAVKIDSGSADYYFQPVYLADPDNPEREGAPTQLDFDEFVADMWVKGIRFGIDENAVRAAIASGKTDRVVVARRLEPVPGRDAQILEVSTDIHRNDAPRQLANGRLDLHSFQNRFPQVKKGERLLRKVPREAGTLGFEMSGMPIEPPVPKDVDLHQLAGLGTVVENTEEGEFLLSQLTGFLSIDRKSNQLSVDDKIVSRDGVSVRTTGNLMLKGNFEEFGEVQEKRIIEGESITVHADVFGNIISRGGFIMLHQNLIGGTATNADGDIKVLGIGSNSTLQTVQGEISLKRAESCVISGTRVVIEQAANCEIMADEVVITRAEGCSIAARKVTIEAAGPRKQSEMTVSVMVPDSARLDEEIAELTQRVNDFDAMLQKRKAEMDALTNLPDVRKYLMLATKVRKKELVLTPEQVPQFQKMAVAVGPALKAIGKISLDVKALEDGKQAGTEKITELVLAKNAVSGGSMVQIKEVFGDTIVRKMKIAPDAERVYDLPAKDIKVRLRGPGSVKDTIFNGARGSVQWDADAHL